MTHIREASWARNGKRTPERVGLSNPNSDSSIVSRSSRSRRRVERVRVNAYVKYSLIWFVQRAISINASVERVGFTMGFVQRAVEQQLQLR